MSSLPLHSLCHHLNLGSLHYPRTFKTVVPSTPSLSYAFRNYVVKQIKSPNPIVQNCSLHIHCPRRLARFPNYRPRFSLTRLMSSCPVSLFKTFPDSSTCPTAATCKDLLVLTHLLHAFLFTRLTKSFLTALLEKSYSFFKIPLSYSSGKLSLTTTRFITALSKPPQYLPYHYPYFIKSKSHQL